jgi:hypothetical protein
VIAGSGLPLFFPSPPPLAHVMCVFEVRCSALIRCIDCRRDSAFFFLLLSFFLRRMCLCLSYSPSPCLFPHPLARHSSFFFQALSSSPFVFFSFLFCFLL